MTTTIDEYLHLSVNDCKRMGFLKPQELRTGTVRWTVNGNERATVGFATDTRGVPVARFSYTCNGTPVNATIYLRWKRSNLNAEHGYYYFVCPVTGVLCRVLYLVDGHFMSRKAFKPLYEQQTKSHRQRHDPLFAYLDIAKAVEDLTKQKYRREFYAGRITPYGRKVEKYCRRLNRASTVIQGLPG